MKSALDNLIPQVKDFAELLKAMERQGYKIKRGKHISFSAEGQERFTRAKSLGEDYTEVAIKKRIFEKPTPKVEEKVIITPEPPPLEPPPLEPLPLEPPPIMPPVELPVLQVPPQEMPQQQPKTPLPVSDDTSRPGRETRPTLLDEKPKPTTAPPPKTAAPTTATTAPKAPEKTGYAKILENRGMAKWQKVQALKHTAEAYNLMQSYGGMEAFMKLYNDCKTYIATIENGIKANEEQITAHGYWREDILTYLRTKPVYTQYAEMKKAKNNITFFGKNRAEEFRKGHENDITDHETASRELKKYPKPTPTIKELDKRIAGLKSANVDNNKALASKKAELKQLRNIHDFLFYLDRAYKPQPPQRQQTQEQNRTTTRKRSNGLDR